MTQDVPERASDAEVPAPHVTGPDDAPLTSPVALADCVALTKPRITATVTFTTAGSPITPTDVEGRTYVLPWEDLTFLEPEGASQFVGQSGIEYLLFESENVNTSAETVDMSLGTGVTDGGTGAVQDTCSPVVEYPGADFSGNPVVEIGPQDFSLQGATVEDMYIAGAFNTDATAFEDIRIRGYIDARTLAFDPCAFGIVTCSPCPDGAISCLQVLAVADSAPYQEGLVLDPALYNAQDPSCQQ